jgi:hypothetical protein
MVLAGERYAFQDDDDHGWWIYHGTWVKTSVAPRTEDVEGERTVTVYYNETGSPTSLRIVDDPGGEN